MYSNKRMLLSVFWFVLGCALIGCGSMGVIDSFWTGMGAGFLVVGVLQLVRHFKYRRNEEYREKVDIAHSDERNKYLSTKAWAWAGYWFVLLGAIGSIAFRVAGFEELSTFCGLSVCLIMILYWLNYMYLNKKY